MNNMFTKINDYINNKIIWLILGFAILSIGLFAACGSDNDESLAATRTTASAASTKPSALSKDFYEKIHDFLLT